MLLRLGSGLRGRTSFSARTTDPGLEKLLEGWEVDDLTILRRDGDTIWSLADGSADGDDGVEKVALVTATRP